MTAVAVGKVMALDAIDPRFPGEVVISVTCSESQARAWAQLLGDTVSAAPLVEATPTNPAGLVPAKETDNP